MPITISLNRLGVRKRLFIILFLIALLLAGCYSYIFITFRMQTLSRVDASAYQTAAILLEQTDGKIDIINKITSSLLQEHYQNNGKGSVFPYLSDYKNSEESYVALSKAFTASTKKLFYLFPSLEGLYLYDIQGNLIIFDSRDFTRLTAPSLESADWKNTIIEKNGGLLLLNEQQALELLYNSTPGYDSLARQEYYTGTRYLYSGRVLINLYHSFIPDCFVVAQLDIYDVNNFFHHQHSYQGQSYAIINSDGKVLSSEINFPMDIFANEQLNFNFITRTSESTYSYKRFTKDDYFFHLITDGSTGISCIISTPTNVVSYSPFIIILVSLLLVLLITILFVQYTFRGITTPIGKLINAYDEIGRGNFSVQLTAPKDVEFGYLIDSFNQMTKKVDNLITTVYLKDIAERDLELQMLRNQINPHFIYNTLESMRMAAYTEGAYNLSQMCLQLADVLRYGVSSPAELVSVEEELSHLEEYITLQQYRLHYAIKITIMVSRELYHFESLKLIFQPLVENAISHGFEGFSGNERINILGYEKEGILYFQVTDNGVGMDDRQVADLNDYIGGKNEKFHSIGLKNVHRRIELYYGSGYGLKVESRKNRGTSVHITIPTHILVKETTDIV